MKCKVEFKLWRWERESRVVCTTTVNIIAEIIFTLKRVEDKRLNSIYFFDWRQGLFGVAFGGGISVIGTLTSPSFAKFMSISAKTSFPVMAGLGLFTYGYEVSMHDAMRCVFYSFYLNSLSSRLHISNQLLWNC